MGALDPHGHVERESHARPPNSDGISVDVLRLFDGISSAFHRPSMSEAGAGAADRQESPGRSANVYSCRGRGLSGHAFQQLSSISSRFSNGFHRGFLWFFHEFHSKSPILDVFRAFRGRENSNAEPRLRAGEVRAMQGRERPWDQASKAFKSPSKIGSIGKKGGQIESKTP